MKLNLRALTITAGIIGVAAILITGIANLIWSGYGGCVSFSDGFDLSGL
jgi:hypothetical protein